MAVKSPLEKILDKHHVELGQLRTSSAGWFQEQVKAMTSNIGIRRPENLMRGDQADKSNKIFPGNMYMFIYDPKYKETLPYYDVFPLVFPFSEVKGGFYGINLHYLPYTLRAQLMGSLLELRDSTGTEKAKLRLSWAKLNAISKHKLIQPCVKHYLYPHVQTTFKKIDHSDWATAMLLPAEKFTKANVMQVWADSIRKVSK
jgi:hypothetical protein